MRQVQNGDGGHRAVDGRHNRHDIGRPMRVMGSVRPGATCATVTANGNDYDHEDRFEDRLCDESVSAEST